MDQIKAVEAKVVFFGTCTVEESFKQWWNFQDQTKTNLRAFVIPDKQTTYLDQSTYVWSRIGLYLARGNTLSFAVNEANKETKKVLWRDEHGVPIAPEKVVQWKIEPETQATAELTVAGTK